MLPVYEQNATGLVQVRIEGCPMRDGALSSQQRLDCEQRPSTRPGQAAIEPGANRSWVKRMSGYCRPFELFISRAILVSCAGGLSAGRAIAHLTQGTIRIFAAPIVATHGVLDLTLAAATLIAVVVAFTLGWLVVATRP